MSIVTFWSDGKSETGKTLSIVAVATFMAIEHNYRILLVSTGHNDEKLSSCFWEKKRTKKNLGLFGPNTNIDMEEGIEGLTRIMNSNKLTADNIKNYTKAVFKDRLEVLQAYKGPKDQYDEIRKSYPEVIKFANKYYDMVLVDLDKELDEKLSDEILANSDLIMVNLTQRVNNINDFIELKEKKPILKSNKTMILIGRHDRFSKYSIKNISRYMGEKNNVLTIPYNTLYFEACEEARVPDLFLRLRRTKEDDRNGFFLAEVRRATQNIVARL